MGKKKVLEELHAKYSEIENEYELAWKNVTAFEGGKEHEKYLEIDEDEKRKEQFPEQYAMYEKELELKKKLEQIKEQEKEAAKEYNNELDKSLVEIEEKLKTLTEQREQLAKETEEINDELKDLKKTDEYKNGDEQALKQAAELEAKLKKNRMNKGKLTKSINALYKEIEKIKEEKELLVAEYGKEILINDSTENLEQPVEEQDKEEQTKQEEIDEKQQQINKIDEQIIALESEIPNILKQRDAMMKEIRKFDKEILELKESEEYKKGDKEALTKVESLEKEQYALVVEKAKIVAKLSVIGKTLKSLKDKKKQLLGQEENVVLNDPITEGGEGTANIGQKINNDEEKTRRTESSSKKKGKRTQQVVYTQPNDSVSEQPKVEEKAKEKTEQKEENKADEKQEFDNLYAKAKNGNLTEQEFGRLAEIMQDAENYDKYGITTGIIFNKSRVILKAMAKVAADTKNTARLSKDELGIKVIEASEENGYLATSEIKYWEGLKALMKKPDRKIASEEMFRQVVALDRTSLTDEQKLIWDKAQSHINKFSQLRNCLSAYERVSTKRRQNSWWYFYKPDEVKPLPESTQKPEEKRETNKGIDLSSKVNDVIDDSEIKPRGSSIDEQNKDAR